MSAAWALTLSVAMHVAWNLIARHQPARSWPLWWVLLFHAVIIAPWGISHLLATVQWTPQFVTLLLLSAIANAGYFASLKRAYDNGPVAMVYPMVRSSPLLIALWSALFFGESLGWGSWLGIVISVLGLSLMLRPHGQSLDHKAIPWALAAMLCTSVYSLSDKAATGHLIDFRAIVGFISIGYLLAFFTITGMLRKETGRWTPPARMPVWVTISGGLAVGLAYALVVHAMRSLPSAEVVAYTNAGIVAATVIAIVFFKERQLWRLRLASSAIICTGLAIMAWL